MPHSYSNQPNHELRLITFRSVSHRAGFGNFSSRAASAELPYQPPPLMRADAMRVLVLLRPTIWGCAECSERLCRRQPTDHARMICSSIFDCWRGNGIKFSMLSTARHEDSPRPRAIKNLGKEPRNPNAGHPD